MTAIVHSGIATHSDGCHLNQIYTNLHNPKYQLNARIPAKKKGCTTKEFQDYLNKHKDQAFNKVSQNKLLIARSTKMNSCYIRYLHNTSTRAIEGKKEFDSKLNWVGNEPKTFY